MNRDLASRLTGDPRVATAIGTAGRALSTALHGAAAGASWAARRLDERRHPSRPDGGGDIGGKRDRGQTVHFVTGELCCVVAAEGVTRENAARFYDALWESLNETATQLIQEWSADPARGRRQTSFHQDMAPTTLRRLSDGARMQQYVGSLRRTPGREQESPFVLLAGPQGQATSLLAFCSAVRADVSPAQRRECVRELVNLLNADVERASRVLNEHLQRRQPESGEIRAARLEAVTPNWLAAGTPEAFTDAGPGAAPAPAPSQGRGRWQFQFDRVTNRPPTFDPLADVVEQQRSRAADGARSGVLVAILDTCPPREQVTKMAGAHPENTLLQEVADPAKVTLGEAPSVDSAALAAALSGDDGRPIKVNWRDRFTPGSMSDDDYLMTDHGVFAAGIVRDIAPTADIRLIRVLDDYGVGDLLSLNQVMSQLPTLLGTDGITRMVVNLSLVVDLPSDAQLLEWWFPRTSRDPKALREHFGEVCRALKMTHASVDRPLACLRALSPHILVVAAAGNDYDGGGVRPVPRLPARDDSVLGVAAVNQYGSPASYSNKGDFVTLGNGVATFGGDATSAHTGGLADVAAGAGKMGGGSVEAMRGLFTAPVFPLSSPPNPPEANQSSWAYWAGTSFATPVISGIAACLWASDAGLPASQLITAVRGYASGSVAGLDCPSIPAYQAFVPR